MIPKKNKAKQYFFSSQQFLSLAMIKLWIDTGKKHTYMTTSLAEK